MKFLYKLPEEVELEYRLKYNNNDLERMIDNKYLIGYMQVVPFGPDIDDELIKYGDDYFATIVYQMKITALYTRTRSYPRRIDDEEWTTFIRSKRLMINLFGHSMVNLRVVE